MKLCISDESKLSNWEALINTIEKTDIPLEFVRNINILFHTPVDNVNEQDIDITGFRVSGYDEHGINTVVEQVFKEHDNNIKSVQFYVDIDHVAKVVQRQTNILLKGI